MAERVIKMPDIGEGIAEAEVVEWHVKIGDLVREDAPIAAVMTDKATIEIPSPVDGEIIWLGAGIGDTVAVGSALVKLKVAGQDHAGATEPEPAPPQPARADRQPPPPMPPTPPRTYAAGAPRPEGAKPIAPPAVRLRAREAGIDLRQVPGTGPAGRITHDDLNAFMAQGPAPAGPSPLQPKTAVEEIKVTGLRRRIAEKMAMANARIPHITYVEEVDVTAVESLRATLNDQKRGDQPRLTLLPFLMRAIVRAVAAQPNLNALFDDDVGIIHQYAGVHIGIATQTPAGLMVPVVRHAETLDAWACATEVNRLAEAARSGTANREELTGSTITITSLGAMGGLISTPIINHPEVAIVGVNKIAMRPVWDGSGFVPRKMMNLSSSFDHRVIDGWDAARFVQRLKTLLETPALIFVGG